MWEESAASLADTGMRVCAVYREWRQGYHSVRQNALGSPSGPSCYHCTTTLQQHTAALCSFCKVPLQSSTVHLGRATKFAARGDGTPFLLLENRHKLLFLLYPDSFSSK